MTSATPYPFAFVATLADGRVMRWAGLETCGGNAEAEARRAIEQESGGMIWAVCAAPCADPEHRALRTGEKKPGVVELSSPS